MAVGQRRRGATATLDTLNAKARALAEHPDAFEDVEDDDEVAAPGGDKSAAAPPADEIAAESESEPGAKGTAKEQDAETDERPVEETETRKPAEAEVPLPEQRAAAEPCWFEGCTETPVGNAIDLPGVPQDAEICKTHLDQAMAEIEAKALAVERTAGGSVGDEQAENQAGPLRGGADEDEQAKQKPLGAGTGGDPTSDEKQAATKVREASNQALSLHDRLLASMGELEDELIEEIRTPTTVNLTAKLADRATKYGNNNGLTNVEVLYKAVFDNIQELPKLVAASRGIKLPPRDKIKFSISPTDTEMEELEAAVKALQVRLGNPRRRVNLSELARVAIEVLTAPKPRTKAAA